MGDCERRQGEARDREGEAPAEPRAIAPTGPSPPNEDDRPGSAGASPSRPTRATAPRWRAVVALYLAVAALTAARFQGDTIDYARHAEEFDLGQWEFGHLWWAPLGRLLGGGTRGGALVALVAVNYAAGLVSALALFGLLRRLEVPAGVALAATAAMLGSQAVLNYLHTGCSYMPGLALLMVALYLAVVAGSGAMWPALGAGLALGASICFWFPYVLVVPAVVLAPLVLVACDRARLLTAVTISAGLALLLGAAYGGAALCLGITDIAGFRAWMASSSHGIETRGLARAVFGLARAFVYMGEDGVLFKRYLLRDPYNPASAADLVTLSLWKVGLFYLALGALAVGLCRGAAARRALVLLALGGVPVFVFGVYWQGGDMERYLPLYPFLFVAVAALWADVGGWRLARGAVAGFFAVALVVNATAYSRPAAAARKAALSARVEGLELPPGSEVLVVRDPLKYLSRDFPFDERTRAIIVFEIATPGQADTPHWRREAAERVLAAWAAGGEVWLSKRLLADAPHPAGAWAEGDDARLKWADIPAFFRELETDAGVGGDDGLVRLRRGGENERRLRAAARGSKQEPRP